MWWKVGDRNNHEISFIIASKKNIIVWPCMICCSDFYSYIELKLLLITKEDTVKDSRCKPMFARSGLRLIIQNGDIRSLGSRSLDKETRVRVSSTMIMNQKWKWKTSANTWKILCSFEGMKNVENKVYLVCSFGLLTSPTSRCTLHSQNRMGILLVSSLWVYTEVDQIYIVNQPSRYKAENTENNATNRYPWGGRNQAFVCGCCRSSSPPASSPSSFLKLYLFWENSGIRTYSS